MGGNGL